MGFLHPPTPIGWRVNGVGIQHNTVLFRVIPHYRITRYFLITVLISRAGSELFAGWGGCGVGCDDSMEESANAIPNCIPALDSRDSIARIVKIAYPRLLYPVSFVSQSRHKRCKPQVDTILSKQVSGWSDSCCSIWP